MQAEKAGRGQNPSSALRTAQPSTTKLIESDKRMGTLTHMPDGFEESVSVAVQLPSNGTGNSVLVRPAATHAVQVIGDLSRLGKKLRDSREVQTKKRTQSEAGIGEEHGDHRSQPKRQRTEDTAVPRAPVLGDGYDHQISQPVSQVISQPVIQPGPLPAPQPIALTPVVRHEPPFAKTPDIQAKIAMFEASRMAKSIMPFQPEKISELFQYLCRAQLWPLLKLEEQRVLHLTNIYGGLPSPYGVDAVSGVGAVLAVNSPSSSSTTTTTTTTTQPGLPLVIPRAGIASNATDAVARQAPLPNPEPTTRSRGPIAQTTQTDPGSNVCKINEWLLPKPPNPPSPDYARDLLSSLPEDAQRLMTNPAAKICEMMKVDTFDLATTNNMANFTCLLVEIASHGGLPNHAGKTDDIIHDLLQHYLLSHRHFDNLYRAVSKRDVRKIGGVRDPAFAYVLRLLPTYPQFARMLGNGINNLSAAQRSHLALSRKFNYVLELMRDRRSRSLSDAEFKQRLDDIIGDASLPAPSSRATASSTTASTPTSAPAERREGDVDEGSDGDI